MVQSKPIAVSRAMRVLWASALLACAAGGQVVSDVRYAAVAGDLTGAESKLVAAKAGGGVWTPELIEAHSWLGRGAQQHKQWEKALEYSDETRRLCTEELKKRPLDAEPRLPIALGASIEVRGHSLAGTGRLSEALIFLRGELKRWHETSIRTRIQKNIHLLSLEGKTAPALDTRRFLGNTKIPAVAALKGKPVLLFFWAHWCGDCKQQGPALAALRKEFPALSIVAPTQHYGYVAGGEEAASEKETVYIADVQKKFYGWMSDVPMPLSEENFKLYGSSTSPTLVLIDRGGIVRLYHSGKMSAEELRPLLAKWAR